MENAILHISDLHFVAEYEREGNSRFSEPFKMCFFNFLKLEIDKKNLKLKYVIVTGDISNSGVKREFDEVIIFLNELCETFKLNKENIIICPGNHDISWENLRNELDEIPEDNRKEPYKYHDIKFKYFKEFYSTFFEGKKEFKEDDAIVDTIIDKDDKIVVLGLNSCYKESFLKTNHIGYIEPKTLKNYIQKLLENHEILEYDKLLVMHHNSEDFKNDPPINNWYEISLILDNHFPAILCGHIHSSKGLGEIKKESNK